MLNVKTGIALLFCLCFSLTQSFAQSFIADTLTINFPNKDSFYSQPFLEVKDYRKENPKRPKSRRKIKDIITWK